MRYLVIFTFFLSLQYTWSQSKIIGYVTELNSGKKHVENVVIKTFGANEITTTSNGDFILTFQDFKPGKNVIVHAVKTGWEIVNEKELNTFIPADPNEKPLKIILCPVGTLVKIKSKYYETFEQNLYNEFTKLKAKYKDDQKEIARIEEDYSRTQKQLSDLADEYSRINLDDANEKELQAIELFNMGKYDEFIVLKQSIVTELEAEKAIKNKQTASKLMANADSTITLYFKSQKDIANTQIMQFKFEEAEKTYENIVSKDTNNFDNISVFAYFLQNQNSNVKAIYFYEKALKLTNNELIASSLFNNLGVLYYLQKDYSKALESYQKALNLSITESKNIGFSFINIKVNLLNNLGIFYKESNNFLKALQFFNEAIEINNNFKETNFITYQINLKTVYSNLGGLYESKNEYINAEIFYKKALDITEKLAKISPQVFEDQVPIILNNLGNIYKLNHNYPEAISVFIKALNINEKLAGNNKKSHEPGLAQTLNNLGNLYNIINNLEKGKNCLNEAIKIYERLSKNNPEAYESLLASATHDLGIALNNSGNYGAALSSFLKAKEKRQKLILVNSAVFLPELAATFENLGLTYQWLKDTTSAIKAHNDALEIYYRIANDSSFTHEEKIAITLNSLGILYQSKRDFKSAYLAHNKALTLYKNLSKKSPRVYELGYCTTIIYSAYLQKNNFNDSNLNETLENLKIVKQILENYNKDVQTEMISKHVIELESYFKNFDVLQPLQELNKRLNETLKTYEKVKIKEEITKKYLQLSNDYFPKFTLELATSLSSLAWSQLFNNQFIEAENSAREALNPTKFKKIENYDSKIEWSNTNLALALLFQGKYVEAEKIYITLKDKPYFNATYRETFLADLEELEKAGITHSDVVRIRELLKK